MAIIYTPGEKFVEAVRKSRIKGRFEVSATAVKSYTDTMITPAQARGYATTYSQDVTEAGRAPLVIRNLFSSEQINGSRIVYMVEDETEGSAAVTGEGEEKSQVHLNHVPVRASLKKIPVFIKESDEFIKDYSFLSSVIDGRLAYELEKTIQNELVSDLLSNTDIQADTSTWTDTSSAQDVVDMILQAILDVEDYSGEMADAIVMSSATWYKLRAGKDSDGKYLNGGVFGAGDTRSMWGLPVYVTNAVNANTIIVGAFQACGTVVSRGEVDISLANTNEDDFIKDQMTLRAEERIALAIRKPKGFKAMTKES